MSTLGAVPPNQKDILKRGGGKYNRKRKANAIPGGGAMPLDRKKNAARSNLARNNGQDLMRGEHDVGATASPYGAYGKNDDTSQRNALAQPQSGTSIFDPVLCELAYRWFCPAGGKIIDPFAGGSVRGIVASMLGFKYTGIDLRDEQIEANIKQAETICVGKEKPQWICGDSINIGSIATGKFDLIFSCPPYGDLEVYSEDSSDLSTMNHADFLKAYRSIVSSAMALLNPDRFACFVVGDFRDSKGFYRNFVADTVAAFQDAGARLYNEAVLVTAIGSLPIRCGRHFESMRKLGKTHQNILVFFKGDPKAIKTWPLPDFGEAIEESACP